MYRRNTSTRDIYAQELGFLSRRIGWTILPRSIRLAVLVAMAGIAFAGWMGVGVRRLYVGASRLFWGYARPYLSRIIERSRSR